ncbi:MAG: hypothetical protein HJJLKODD_00272 [Phycisphaerae bacterium]|nr:hypothetical protein [Phycisphaerae bacterium]
MKIRIQMITLGLLVSLVQPAWAIPDEMVTVVPRDVLAALWVDPTAVAAESNSLSGISGAVQWSQHLGLWSSESPFARRLLDIAHAWPIVRQFPQVYVLQNIRFEPLGEVSVSLAEIRGGILIRVGERRQLVDQEIQHFLQFYTNDATSKVEACQIGGMDGFRFTDQRLPKGHQVSWGVIGDWYLVAVGDETSITQLIKTVREKQNGLESDSWIVTGRQQTRAESAVAQLYVHSRNVLQKTTLRAQESYHHLLLALGLANYERGLWSFGRQGRAVTWIAYYQAGNDSRRVVLASADAPSAEQAARIPDAATWYLLLNHDGADLIRRIRGAYLSVRHPASRAKLLKEWEVLAGTSQIDAEADLLQHLGSYVLIHNHPRHPLGWPIMCTIDIPIAGDAGRVRQTVDDILEYCMNKLDALAQLPDRPLIVPILRQTPERMWYTLIGLYGPALCVDGQHLLISYSPEALRQNLPAASQPVVPEQIDLPPTATQPSRANDAF